MTPVICAIICVIAAIVAVAAALGAAAVSIEETHRMHSHEPGTPDRIKGL